MISIGDSQIMPTIEKQLHTLAVLADFVRCHTSHCADVLDLQLLDDQSRFVLPVLDHHIARWLELFVLQQPLERDRLSAVFGIT